MDFRQFSRNNTYICIPGKLSEINLYAWLFSNPCGKVLIIVGISWSPDLRVHHLHLRIYSRQFFIFHYTLYIRIKHPTHNNVGHLYGVEDVDEGCGEHALHLLVLLHHLLVLRQPVQHGRGVLLGCPGIIQCFLIVQTVHIPVRLVRDLEQAALLDDTVQGLAVQALGDLLGLLKDLLPEPLLGEVADTRRLQPLPEILHVLGLEHHPGAGFADSLQHLQKTREVGIVLHWMREFSKHRPSGPMLSIS